MPDIAHDARMAAKRRAEDSKETIVRRLRASCLAFPDANERISHGSPTWFAGKGKVFAMLDDHHHGAEHLSVWVPAPDGVQATLVEAAPDRYFRPPYMGPSGWIGVVLDTRPDWAAVEEHLRDAYLHVAGKRLRERLLSGAG